MNEYIKKSEAVDVIVKYPYNVSGKTATAIRMIESLPSADVVPKSEVESIITLNSQLEAEVFEQRKEIESLKKSIFPSYSQAISEEVAIKIGKEYGKQEAKEEIEKLNVELNAMRGAANSYKMHYEKAKAEVGKLQNELVIWKQNRFNLFQRLECYKMARQKVASEIFAEIEKEIDRGVSVIEKILNTKGGRANGKTVLLSKYDVYREAKKYIAELKKKYTEGEDKPAATEEKYFSPEDVRKMTNQEVREKYTAIRRSMERW